MADKRLRPATANLRGAGATSPAIQGARQGDHQLPGC